MFNRSKKNKKVPKGQIYIEPSDEEILVKEARKLGFEVTKKKYFCSKCKIEINANEKICYDCKEIDKRKTVQKYIEKIGKRLSAGETLELSVSSNEDSFLVSCRIYIREYGFTEKVSIGLIEKEFKKMGINYRKTIKFCLNNNYIKYVVYENIEKPKRTSSYSGTGKYVPEYRSEFVEPLYKKKCDHIIESNSLKISFDRSKVVVKSLTDNYFADFIQTMPMYCPKCGDKL